MASSKHWLCLMTLELVKNQIWQQTTANGNSWDLKNLSNMARKVLTLPWGGFQCIYMKVCCKSALKTRNFCICTWKLFLIPSLSSESTQDESLRVLRLLRFKVERHWLYLVKDCPENSADVLLSSAGPPVHLHATGCSQVSSARPAAWSPPTGRRPPAALPPGSPGSAVVAWILFISFLFSQAWRTSCCSGGNTVDGLLGESVSHSFFCNCACQRPREGTSLWRKPSQTPCKQEVIYFFKLFSLVCRFRRPAMVLVKTDSG